MTATLSLSPCGRVNAIEFCTPVSAPTGRGVVSGVLECRGEHAGDAGHEMWSTHQATGFDNGGDGAISG